MKKDKKRISDYFGMVAVKLGGQIHLRSLRDGFASIMPFMILAGFVIFINYVILCDYCYNFGNKSCFDWLIVKLKYEEMFIHIVFFIDF